MPYLLSTLSKPQHITGKSFLFARGLAQKLFSFFIFLWNVMG